MRTLLKQDKSSEKIGQTVFSILIQSWMQNGSTFMVVHFLFAQGVFCDIKMIQIVAFCLKDVVYGSGIPLKHLFKRTSIFQVWLLLSVTMSRRPRIIQRRFDNSFFFLGPLTVLLIPFPFLLVHISQTLQVWDSFLTCCLRVFGNGF